jgi:uncharacterized protein (AIM24 family)
MNSTQKNGNSNKKKNLENTTKLVKNINIRNKNQTQIIFKNNDKSKFNGISYKIIGEGGIQSIEFKIDPGKHILVTPGNMNIWNSNLDYIVEYSNKNSIPIFAAFSTNVTILKAFNPLTIKNKNNTKSYRMDISSNFISSIGTIYLPKTRKICLCPFTFICSTAGINQQTSAQFSWVGFGLNTFTVLEARETDALIWFSVLGTLKEIVIKPGEKIKIELSIAVAFDYEIFDKIKSVLSSSSFWSSLWGGEFLVYEITNDTNKDLRIYVQNKGMYSLYNNFYNFLRLKDYQPK